MTKQSKPGVFFIALSQFAYSPFREALLCLLAIPLVFSGAYKASYFWETNLFIFAGVITCVALAIFPAFVFTGVFLLWWNPEKYKEYDMKKRIKQRELEQQRLEAEK